ncbi:NUDIX hydrolase [Spirochaeta dissipatitropha]
MESGLTMDCLKRKKIVQRLACRAIVRRQDSILLLYTQRYHDYSLPGGGLEPNEDPVQGLIRELEEETGAQGIRNIQPFGKYEEYRPWYKPENSILHMISWCYTLDADFDLGESRMEHYEVQNGMEPRWVCLSEAIRHNEETIKNSPHKGQSIERETYILSLLHNQDAQQAI